MTELPVKTIDQDYPVLHPLGEGLAGDVYLVKKGGKEMALKLLKHQVGSLNTQEAEAHFKAEFLVLKQLAHPHIARIMDFGIDRESGRYYYTSEFISGGNLFAESRKLSPEALEDLLVQALRALEYLQAHGIAHYDLKPENLLIDSGKQELKIIDFGMAGFRPRGQLAGTPAYMAPEILLGNPPDPRADLYSLGVTFYECFTGSNPFRAKSLSETLKRQETLSAPRADSVRKEISAATANLLQQLLQKNPADRPATAGMALRAFARLSGKKISQETESTSLSYLPNETRLIGRESELAAFNKKLDALKEGQRVTPPLFLVVGAKGMGKTRLLKEFRFTAQLSGLRVADLSGTEIPELHGNTCLFWDDANPEALSGLTAQLEGSAHSVWLVASLAEPPAAAVAANAELHSLKSFGEKEIAAYLKELTGLAQAPEALVAELHRRTEGSPFFLTEILRELIRRGVLFDENGRWTADNLEDLGVDFSVANAPEQLKTLLLEEYRKLDRPAQTLLEFLAVAEQAASVEWLQQVAGVEEVPYWILELLNQGFINREETSQSYRLKNPYLRESLWLELKPSRLEKIHGAWAEFLEKTAPDSEAALFHRGRSGKNLQAAQALLELASRKEREGRLSEALEHLLLAESAATGDPEQLALLQIKAAVDLLQLGRTDEALIKLETVRKNLSEMPKSPKTLALKIGTFEKLGGAYLRANQLPQARQCFESGLQLMKGKESEFQKKRVLYENYLGRILFREGKLDEARKIFERTRRDWQEALTPEEQRVIINNDLGAVLLAEKKFDAAEKQFLEDLDFFRQIHDEFYQAKCLYNLAETKIVQKKPEEAIRYYQECIGVAKGQKNFDILLRAYNGLGNLYEGRRDYESALKQYERALPLAQKSHDLRGQASIETNLGIVLNGMGQPAKGLPHLLSALRLLPSGTPQESFELFLKTRAQLELAESYLQLKETPRAAELLAQCQEAVDLHESLSALRFTVATARIRQSLQQGDRAQATKLLAELKPSAKNSEEVIEWAKLENFLQKSPEDLSREPAVTQTGMSYTPSREPSLYLSAGSGSDYAKLLELTRFINAETNLDFVLKSVLQYALELSGAERGLILLLDDKDRLEIRASLNLSVNPNLSEISSRVAEQVLRTGDLLETDDATQDDRLNEYQSVMILKLRSILCLPIRSRNQIVGTLYLDNRYRPGAFRKTGLPLLQAFCDQAGIAIENAKLFEKYERAQAELTQRLEKAEETVEHYHELVGETQGNLPTKYSYDNMVARSKPMHEVFKTLDKITETNISVFINGETGTGKELIAKALHYNNKPRSEKRFVAINCGGIPPNLIESELFGYKAGAFTGATRDKKGIFVDADGGTLFMDEIAELDMSLQVKLLRALEEGEVTPVGDTRPVNFDVRVVSASHKNLEDMIAKGEFREDLYYRICQIRIKLPPLRERREDIPALAERFAEHYAKENNWKRPAKISGNLLKKLMEYDWPGNIRELENTIRVACALSDEKEITMRDLPENFGMRKVSAKTEKSDAPVPEAEASPGKKVSIDGFNKYDSRLNWEDYERRIFAKTYEAAEFKPLIAAESLSVSPATFYKRLKDFDLNNRSNPVYQDKFVIQKGKSLREYLEDIFWAAYECSDERAYTAIKWLGVSQGHFYNVLKVAKKKHSS